MEMDLEPTKKSVHNDEAQQCEPVADPGFPNGGMQPQRRNANLLFSLIFFRKLHDCEKRTGDWDPWIRQCVR